MIQSRSPPLIEPRRGFISVITGCFAPPSLSPMVVVLGGEYPRRGRFKGRVPFSTGRLGRWVRTLNGWSTVKLAILHSRKSVSENSSLQESNYQLLYYTTFKFWYGGNEL
jgi:hypothetical protein